MCGIWQMVMTILPVHACAILVAASAVTNNGLRTNTDLVAIYNGNVPEQERF